MALGLFRGRDKDDTQPRFSRVRKGLFGAKKKKWWLVAKQKLSDAKKKVVMAALVASCVYTSNPRIVSASGPMVLKQMKVRDKEKETIENYRSKRGNNALVRKIEGDGKIYDIVAEKGEEAGERYKAQLEKEAREGMAKRAKEERDLKLSLLEQGICPFVDPEGIRQCFLLESKIDLANIKGTRQYLDRHIQREGEIKEQYERKRYLRRSIIKFIVQDFKARDIDYLAYFDKYRAETFEILFQFSEPKLHKTFHEYRDNLKKYGQILAPVEGEPSVLELLAKDPDWFKKNPQKKVYSMTETLKMRRAEATFRKMREKKAAKEAEKAAKEAEKAAKKAEKEARKAGAGKAPKATQPAPHSYEDDAALSLQGLGDIME